MGQVIPIFFACNDKYVPYLDVAITSLQAHANSVDEYRITILKTDVSEENQKKIKNHESDNLKIAFFDVQDILRPIEKTLPDMFYYTLAAYYRFFIEKAFPQYDKAIYLDCDVVLLADIAELYRVNLGDNLVGAAYEQNTDRDPMFTNYVKDIIGIPYNTYFNSGVMVMNLKEFRRFGVQDKFLDMLTTYNFDCLAPDQEYLNVICSGRVKYLPTGWNKHSFPEPPEGKLNLCHYALALKPWHYENVINGEYFWKYAKQSQFYDIILKEFNNYTDADRQKDREAFMHIVEGIKNMYKSERTFKKLWFTK